MRYARLAAIGTAVLLSACNGSEARDGVPLDGVPLETSSHTDSTGGATGTTYLAATGTIHEVRMVGDRKGYRYDPDTIRVKPGDGIKFVMVSGGPHNVAFDPAAIPADQRPQLFANLKNPLEPGVSYMMMNPDEVIELSLTSVAPGRYSFFCSPHLAMKMTGLIVVTD